MKTIKDLTPDQYNLLSWFATYCRNCKVYSWDDEFHRGKLQGIQSACTFAGIPDNLIYEVEINGIYTGLKNCDKLTFIQIFA